jgi:hypothetical protein
LKNKAHDVRKPDVGANFGYEVLYGDPKIEFSVRRGEGKREKREGERGKEREELLRLRSARQSGDRD